MFLTYVYIPTSSYNPLPTKMFIYNKLFMSGIRYIMHFFITINLLKEKRKISSCELMSKKNNKCYKKKTIIYESRSGRLLSFSHIFFPARAHLKTKNWDFNVFSDICLNIFWDVNTFYYEMLKHQRLKVSLELTLKFI